MTTAHLAKMHEAKLAADIARMQREDQSARQYMSWLAQEARAFIAYKETRDAFGMGDEVTQYNYAEWRRIVTEHPGTPNDSSMRRVRGET